jgi:hypothetical protein
MIKRKGDVLCTDEFDVVAGEVANLEINFTNYWGVLLVTKQGKEFQVPTEEPLKTKEEAITFKKHLRDEYIW